MESHDSVIACSRERSPRQALGAGLGVLSYVGVLTLAARGFRQDTLGRFTRRGYVYASAGAVGGLVWQAVGQERATWVQAAVHGAILAAMVWLAVRLWYRLVEAPAAE